MKRILLAVLIALCLPAPAQAPLNPINSPVFRALDSNGKPLTGGKLFSYQAGTTTLQATFTDATGATPNTNPVILDSTGTAKVFLAPVAYKFVLQNQFGVVQWTVDDILGSAPGVAINPGGDQTITQPVNTNLTVNTSGTGSSIFNGNVQLNHNKIQDDFNYFNYRFSSNDYQAPSVASTGRTWSNPEFYYAVNDNSAYSTNPNPQGDLTITPIIHIESFNNSPNDAAPIYLNQRCSATVEGNPGQNNGCVGLMAAVSNTATSESFLESANFIMQINSTDPLVQAQGVELNAFNNSGADSLLQANTTFTRGPYLGFSATAGGNNKMVAGFHTTDQGHGSGWQYGLWVESASGADILLGFPGGGAGGNNEGIQLSPINAATSTTNSPSLGIDFRTAQWNGTTSSPFSTTLNALTLSGGVSPVTCMNVSFTSPGSVANICNDGSIQMRGTSWHTFNGSPTGNCKSGDFGTNASPADLNSVFYVCFPTNVWNPVSVP